MLDLVGASLLATCVALILYKIFQDDSNYWTKVGAKYVRPKVPYLSEMYELLMTPIDQLVLENRKKNGIIYGVKRMGKRRLIVNDPEVVRQICIRDFDYFPNREVASWTNDYNKNSLVWTKDEHWKRVRTMMSPTFTSGKIKRMFKLMDECANDLVENLGEQYVRTREELRHSSNSGSSSECQVDLVKLFEMYTMDGIATCCYGIKLRREQEEQAKNGHDNKQQSQDLSYASREVFANYAGRMLKWNKLRAIFVSIMPEFILNLLDFKIIPNSELKPLADRVQKMIDMRRKQKSQTNKYDDLLQLLVDAKFDDKMELNDLDQKENHHASLTHESLLEDQNKLKESVIASSSSSSSNDNKQQVALSSKTKLSDMEILCEAMLLLAAGLDTTRASLSTITYFLAHNMDVQERLVEELQAIAQYAPTAEGKKVVYFNYESLTSCEYLDAVISEGLRRFTPVVAMSREAKRDYFIEKYKISVPKGMFVQLGIYAIHMDPQYWSEPEKFNPDRFMPGQREKIVPGTYLPFTMGPRHCIGMRFSLTETKLGLAKALMNFKFLPAQGTKYPPVAEQSVGIMTINDCRAIVVPRERCE